MVNTKVTEKEHASMKTPELWLDSSHMVKSGTQNIVQAVQFSHGKTQKSLKRNTVWKHQNCNLTSKKIFLDRTLLIVGTKVGIGRESIYSELRH